MTFLTNNQKHVLPFSNSFDVLYVFYHSINKVHFYINYIPQSDFSTIKIEALWNVKSVLILKTQDVFENTRCLDLNNATVLSLFAMLCGTNRIAKLSCNCLHRRHPAL